MITRLFTFFTCLTAMACCYASDHADPIDLGPMFSSSVQERDRESGITDLHVYLDSDQDPSLGGKPTAVVFSFCVGRALAPLREKNDDDEKDAKTIPVYPPEKPSNLLLPRHPKAMRHSHAHANEPPPSRPIDVEPYTYRIHIDTDPEISSHSEADNARYGATLLNPNGIVEEITLEVKLDNDLKVKSFLFNGLRNYDSTGANDPVVSNGPQTPYNKGKIHVRSGVFDDPFIFPRFFRTNVIGIVIQIPLKHFDETRRNWLIWGTTMKGKKQIDHVGRSQRTQLPRFDYLNTLHPSKHVAEINRVHEHPTIIEDFRRTVISPLFARRHYDAVPDVMIWRRDQPTGFPNGRKLSDDVAGIIAKTGDTQLFELSYADSTEFPRATLNDGYYERDAQTGMLKLVNGQPVQRQLKQYRTVFPYLAEPWTVDQVNAHPVPRPSRAVLSDRTLNKIYALAVGGLLGLAALFLLTWRSGYRTGKYRHSNDIADGFSVPQGLTNVDHEPGSTYTELHRAVIHPNTSRSYYEVWGKADESRKELPRHFVSFWRVAKGILPLGIPWSLADATRRTLKSKADLRWGRDNSGFQRLIHPNGVCLSGTWEIDDTETGYTGYFGKGKRGLIIARISPSREETRRDFGWRSLGFVGKIFPIENPKDNTCRKHAAFITQEDLGGVKKPHLKDSIFLNAPDVSSWRRGKGVFSLVLSGLIFARVNVNATIRQLYEIAELGKRRSEETKCPTFMRLKMASPSIQEGLGLDVRDEIMGLIYDPGNPIAQRKLIFSIEVSDEPENTIKRRFLDAFIRREIPESSWKKIGKIVFDEASCGYNGDFVIHFRHPKWRNDLNEQESVAEVK